MKPDKYLREIQRVELAREAQRIKAVTLQNSLFEDADMKEIVRAAQVREVSHAKRRKKK